jgi:hypothetical protein
MSLATENERSMVLSTALWREGIGGIKGRKSLAL